MAISVLTWNINSVRLRIDNVRRVASELKPDVICLQETKTLDEFFPREAIETLGYRHVHINGMKSYNGVAILSRVPLKNVRVESWCEREDCRHAIAELPADVPPHPPA